MLHARRACRFGKSVDAEVALGIVAELTATNVKVMERDDTTALEGTKASVVRLQHVHVWLCYVRITDHGCTWASRSRLARCRTARISTRNERPGPPGTRVNLEPLHNIVPFVMRL